MEDHLNSYIRSAKRHPRLTAEEELVLFETIFASDDPKKKDVEDKAMKIVNANLGLVIDCAMKKRSYITASRGRMSIMDLIGEGNQALMKAAKAYNPHNEKQTRFSTYACTAIMNALRRSLLSSKFIKVPEHYYKHRIKIEKLIEEHGGEVSNEFLAEKLGITISQLSSIRDSMAIDVITWDVFIKENHAATSSRLEATVDRNELGGYMARQVECLSKLEQKAIVGVFFEGKTITAIAKENGLPRAKIDSSYATALRRLRISIKKDYGTEMSQKIMSFFI